MGMYPEKIHIINQLKP